MNGSLSLCLSFCPFEDKILLDCSRLDSLVPGFCYTVRPCPHVPGTASKKPFPRRPHVTIYSFFVPKLLGKKSTCSSPFLLPFVEAVHSFNFICRSSDASVTFFSRYDCRVGRRTLPFIHFLCQRRVRQEVDLIGPLRFLSLLFLSLNRSTRTRFHLFGKTKQYPVFSKTTAYVWTSPVSFFLSLIKAVRRPIPPPPLPHPPHLHQTSAESLQFKRRFCTVKKKSIETSIFVPCTEP